MSISLNRKRKIVKFITVFSALVFVGTFYRAVFYIPTDEIPLPQITQAEQPITPEIPINKSDPNSFPARLVIPKISVDTKVQDVGVTKKGNMGTPNNFTDVGWYKYGPLPGEMGSAVLAGHVSNGLALAGVFFHLNELGVGDDIYVTTKGGEDLHFIVREMNTYPFNAKDTNVFTENDGKLLKLITCAGTWVSQIRTHDKRLVVTAVLSPN
jgi:LPXTG-site transpeptidase (sortase) family protein